MAESEMSHDARPGRRVPHGLVLVLVLVLLHTGVDRLEHSCDVLGSRGLEGSGSEWNFGLMWGRQEGGLRKD